MNHDPLRERRIRLLRKAWELTPLGEPIALDGTVAREAGYDVAYGESEYYKVFKHDVEELELDGAILPATEHRGYEISQRTLYWITELGKDMLFEDE